MKTFNEFIKDRDGESGLGNLGIGNSSENSSLMRLARIAIDDHYKETMDFFRELANKDDNFKSELERYESDMDDSAFNKNNFPADKEVQQVVPSSADNAMGEV